MTLTMYPSQSPETPLERAQLDYLNSVNSTYKAMLKLGLTRQADVDRLERRLTRPTLTLAGPRQPMPLERASRIIREAHRERTSISAMFAYVIALDRETKAQQACEAANQ